MTILNVAGWAMMLLPCALLLAFLSVNEGVRVACLIYAMAVSVLCVIHVGATLAGFE